MAIAQVPPEIMALTIDHQNLKTLGHYDRSVYLKHFVAEALLCHSYDEEIRDLLDFDWHYTQQLALWNGKEIPTIKAYLADINHAPLPCLSFIALEVPSDFFWPLVIGSARMKDLVAHIAKVKHFGPIGAVSSNLQGSNLFASTIPTIYAVESDWHRSTTLVPLAETSCRSKVLIMCQPQTSAMIRNQRGNLLNSQVLSEVSPEVPKYHNSQSRSQELFSSKNDDVFETVFLESIKELEDKAFKFQGKKNVNPSITLSAEKLKIMEANK